MSPTPLVLLHGALADHRQFDSLLPHLDAFPCLEAPDFGGHGSRPLHGLFTPQTFVTELLELLDERGWSQVDLFGYSLGGYVALMLARQAPDRVRRIHTLATKLIWTTESAERETRFLDPDKLAAKVPSFAAQLERTHNAFGWRELLGATKAMMHELAHGAPLDECFERIEQPVMLAVGDRDTTAGVEDTVRIWRRLPNASLQVIPGLPHPFEKAEPTRVASSLNAFFHSP
jgi:pimeloyl-ACP methyl ester carboxylesterase